MGRILSAKSLSVRILLVTFLALGIMAVYFTYNAYRTYLTQAESQLLETLDAIAKSTAIHLDGDLHEYLNEQYTTKDAITSNDQDSAYAQIQGLLRKTFEANEQITTDIYTLVRSPQGEYFEFIVSSATQPYFRHSYMEYPRDLKDKFMMGGKLEKHESENGVWLSAFEPIRNAEGQVVAVLMVDKKFNDFLNSAWSKLLKDIGISLFILLLIGAFLYRFLSMVIRNEEEQKENLEKMYRLISTKNRAISDSINYAKRIQDALIPDEDVIRAKFPDSYVFFRGKDVVSGDFPWMFRLEDENQVLLATVDCTGHGVPGALLSIIGYFLLNDIIKSKGITEPGQVLEHLHNGVVNALNQQEDEAGNNDGMDVALVKIHLHENKVEFAGAHRPLVWVHQGEVKEVKGDRLAIGGTQYLRKMKKIAFTNHVLEMAPGDSIHFFSDGYPDQIGGPHNRRMMTKNMKRMILDHHQEPMQKLGDELEQQFEDWKGTEMQLDDVLVIGIRFS